MYKVDNILSETNFWKYNPHIFKSPVKNNSKLFNTINDKKIKENCNKLSTNLSYNLLPITTKVKPHLFTKLATAK